MRAIAMLVSAGLAASASAVAGSGSGSGDAGLLASWSFDESDGATAHDSVGNRADPIQGFFKRMPGVSGNALRLDGYTTSVVRAAKEAPRVGQAFSMEAWVAVGAYPWNWAPVIDQTRTGQAGYSFGIDAFGHFGLQVAVDGQVRSLVSTAPLPLRKWAYIAATFDSARGIALYLDGRPAGELRVQGGFDPAPREDIVIGRVRDPILPAGWIHPKYAVSYALDALLDELRLFDHDLTPSNIAADFNVKHASGEQVLPFPVLPSGPPGTGRFGAYYAHLKYEDIWDEPRRVGPDTDVVVRFDQMPIRLVFWQGTNYVPAWVTENGKWYTDEFIETGGPVDCPGGEDCEPMSDKQNRYSHVRVLQSNDARAVVHWRYALCETEHYGLANVDPYTGWSDWADEYYTVYPDGSAVRKQTVWTSNFKTWHEFQETIVINQPGTRPEDNIEAKALTLANMNGDEATYSWEPHSPQKFEQPSNPNIQMVNLKSKWKPFQIVSPVKSRMKPYTGERTWSMFEWWNHWPVAQIASSGISAVAPDRASHSSLSHIYWEPYAQTSNSMTEIMLDGLTKGAVKQLVPMAKAWLSPAAASVNGPGFRSEGYDPTQRAFVFARSGPASRSLSVSMNAAAESPVVNPVLIVRNWGEADARLRVDGRAVEWGTDARRGHEPSLEGTDLVIWLKIESTRPLRIEVVAAGATS